MPKDAPNGNLFIMAIVKAVIAIMLVATAMYCVIMQIETPQYFIELVLGVLGIYFGFSALLYKQSAQANNARLIRLISAIVEEQLRQYEAYRLKREKE